MEDRWDFAHPPTHFLQTTSCCHHLPRDLVGRAVLKPRWNAWSCLVLAVGGACLGYLLGEPRTLSFLISWWTILPHKPQFSPSHQGPSNFPGSWEVCRWLSSYPMHPVPGPHLALFANEMGDNMQGRTFASPTEGQPHIPSLPCAAFGWTYLFLVPVSSGVERGESLGPWSIWLDYINLWMRSSWLRQGALFGFPWTVNREIKRLTK